MNYVNICVIRYVYVVVCVFGNMVFFDEDVNFFGRFFVFEVI